MPSYDAQIEYFCTYWRRKIAQGDSTLADLKTLADSLYAVAGDQVIITKTGFDTANTTEGVVNIPKWVMGKAIEELIAELDEDAPAAPSVSQGTSFGYRPVEV